MDPTELAAVPASDLQEVGGTNRRCIMQQLGTDRKENSKNSGNYRSHEKATSNSRDGHDGRCDQPEAGQ